ncbi:MAG: ankyrin repeat domain-containing protein [Rhodocyclaceae bacterium]|nr:ankyrin repeat domain-containing protein [Rhodocyclaceae bacterium]MDZ4214636.1 ankyrin repeat domain-containing protein [Rhodocyclaceae bacterium]
MITSQRFLSLLIILLGMWGGSGIARADASLGQNELPIHDVARMGTQADMERMLKGNPALRDTPTTALGSMPLHLAALNLDSGPLKALLAAGAPVNVRDKNGATPLHMAAFATRTENAKLLLQAGADPLIKTHEGRDVASLARRVRADEVAGIVSMWLLKGCKAGMACF